jgi:hypothetical protein
MFDCAAFVMSPLSSSDRDAACRCVVPARTSLAAVVSVTPTSCFLHADASMKKRPAAAKVILECLIAHTSG